MKTRAASTLCLAELVAALVFAPAMFGAAAAPAAKSVSDIQPPHRRQEVVDRALKLANPPTPAPEAADLPQPFFPADFDKPDPDEARPGAPAGPRPAAGTGAAAPAAVAQPSGPTGNREILETLAARLVPSGTITLGASPQLIIGKNRFPVGTKFTVTFNNEDYELELVSIDRTTFTLRYRGEEITRPIKPVR